MQVATSHCDEKDGFTSGATTARMAMARGNIVAPDLVLAFCSGRVDPGEFYRGLRFVVGKDVPIVGGSAIGIITEDHLSYQGYPAGAAILESEKFHCRIATAGALDLDEKLAGTVLSQALSRESDDQLLLVFYDSIKITPPDDAPPILNASTPLIQGIEHHLDSAIPIIGAGLVGDYAFSETTQFCGFHSDRQSVVGVMLGGDFKPYARIMHGCTPLDGVYRTITRIEGQFIYELDGQPIVEIIDALYGDQDWRLKHPVDLLTLGQNHGERYEKPEEANYVNRLISGALPGGEGIAIFEPDFRAGTQVQFMLRDTAKMIESARKNTTELMHLIAADGRSPLFGLYIDCAGRTASYSNATVEEATAVQEIFRQYEVPLFGFYSGVEIAPLLGRSRGLDWTGVLLVLAEE